MNTLVMWLPALAPALTGVAALSAALIDDAVIDAVATTATTAAGVGPETLPLRDAHALPAPGWWPPPVGAWLVFGLGLLVLLALGIWLWRRRQRQARHRAECLRLFDQTFAAATTPPAQVAALSELLRRAARQHHPGAEALDGEAWLQFLDRGRRDAAFTAGPGRRLLDGAFRPRLAAADVQALRPLVLERFLQLMRVRT